MQRMHGHVSKFISTSVIFSAITLSVQGKISSRGVLLTGLSTDALIAIHLPAVSLMLKQTH